MPKLSLSRNGRGLLLAVALVVLAFARWWFDLVEFALNDDLYSHALLIPGVTLYLVWLQRDRLAQLPATPARGRAVFALIAGLAIAGAYALARQVPIEFTTEAYLVTMTAAFIVLLAAVVLFWRGTATLHALAFPLGFLVFLAPVPPAALQAIETFLQHGSALAATALFKLSGTPVFQSDLVLRLPGINLEVAPECSGIRSSLVLFIVSTLAGYLFLRRSWARAVLALAVIPLAVLRNGFRIWTIGELCVQISPDMIHSVLHRRGGPLFFAASLVPLFLLLYFLRKTNRDRSPESA